MNQPSHSKLRTIIVVAIVISAVAIAVIPFIRKQTVSDQQRICISNLKKLWVASSSYAEDNGGWMPIYINEMPNGNSSKANLMRGIQSPVKLRSSLSRYLKDDSAWFCPSDVYAGKNTSIGGTWHMTSSYTFAFCQPGVLRSDGLVKGNKALISDIGRPSKFGLISDYVIPTESGFIMAHKGRMSLVFLDGHMQF